MWDKFSFRIKITVIFSVCLLVLTISLTTLSLMNVQQNITNPMQMSLAGADVFFLPASDLTLVNVDGNIGDFSTIDQILEALDNGLGDIHTFSEEEIEQLLQKHGNAVSSIPIEQLQAQLSTTQQDFRQYSLWVAGAIIVLGTLGAYWVAGVIARPIKKLSTSVKGIEVDKLHESLPLPKSQDEISQLTLAFNEMLDKLHRSFESKQLFAQNAAHELKTPLAIIRADMEVMEMNDKPTVGDYEEAFVEIKKNTERMIDLVEGLLAMGKSPSQADMIVFHGRDLFAEILEELKESIHSKNLNIEVNGDANMKGEKLLLHQAFFNLMSNAVRYNVEDGSIVVTLSENQITIEDTGIGIPPESIGQIFDPFYCVDNSRSKKLGGNGLGLAIAKNILDTHDMRIDLTSEVGVGTLITIHI